MSGSSNGVKHTPVCGKCRQYVGDSWWGDVPVFEVLCEQCHTTLFPFEIALEDESEE